MKNVKIGNTVYNGIKKLRVKQADDTFATFTDDDEIASSEKLAQVCSGTVTTLTQQDLAGCTSIKDYLFQFANLSSIDLPNTVTSIGNNAFANTQNLTSIEIPSSFDESEDMTKHSQQFSNSALQTVTFREGAKTLSQSMFYQCSSLQNVTLPNSLVWTTDNVFTNAFEGCSSFVGTNYNGVAYAGNTANPYMVAVRITENGLTNLDLHSDCKMICTDVFNDTSNLNNIQGVITIPDNVLLAAINEQSIGMYASSVDMIELSSNMIEADNLVTYSDLAKYIGVKNPTMANIITSNLSSYSNSKSDKILYKVETSELPSSPTFDTNINSSLEATSQTYEFTNDSNINSWSTSCNECGGSGSVYGQCTTCNGSGQDPNASGSNPCTVCNGTGKQPCSNSECNGSGNIPGECSTCGGSGNVTCDVCNGNDSNCSNCGGSGSIMCINCNGTGRDSNNPVTCPDCNGTGEQDCYNCGGTGVEPTSGSTCPECGGSGYSYNQCTTCNGQGRITDSNIITSPLYRIIGTNKYYRKLYNI